MPMVARQAANTMAVPPQNSGMSCPGKTIVSAAKQPPSAPADVPPFSYGNHAARGLNGLSTRLQKPRRGFELMKIAGRFAVRPRTPCARKHAPGIKKAGHARRFFEKPAREARLPGRS